MSLQQAIADLQTGITTTLTTGATATGNAISVGLSPLTTATTNIVGGFTSQVSNSVTTLSDSLYDANNQSGILYDIQQGVNSLGTSVSSGLASTSAAVDTYTKETGKQITSAATYIVIGLALLTVSLFINAYAVNTLDKTIRTS